MKKTLLTLVLICLLTTGVSCSNSAKVNAASKSSFTDISGHWAADSIETAVKAGILNGYADGTFKPNNPISRAELLKVIALTFGFKPTETSTVWYAPYKTVLTNAGIYMAGDYTADINKSATRNELAKFAVRGANASYRSKSLTAAELMFRAVNAGIMSRVGTNADTVQPAGTTTRAQAAVVVTRLLKLKSGGTLAFDKGASTAAEVAWHKHNMITMFDQNDLVKLPYRKNINANYDVIIDQLLILDPTDTSGYYSEYLEGMQYNMYGQHAKPSDGYLFAYKLIGKNLVATNYYQTIGDSFYMYTEGNSGYAYIAKKYNYFDGLVSERKGLFTNRSGMSFAKKDSTGHDYYFVFVDKDFIQSQIKTYGAFPIHLEKFGNQMNKSSQFYLTETKDLWVE